MIERKYLAHFLDANHVHTLDLSNLPTSYSTSTNYTRLGEHLEQYNEELNPQVDVHRNILGEPYIIQAGYQPQSGVETFYVSNKSTDANKALSDWLQSIVLDRLTGEDTKTTMIDAFIDMSNPTGLAVWAYKEDVYVVPQSFGGDTSGIQLPFQIYKAGKRVKVGFNPSTLKITGLAT